MTRNLYLFRHGQTNENAEHKRYGMASGGYLTELGQAQAEELAVKLAKAKIDVIYASPYLRSVHTAVIVGQKHNEAMIITDERLREGVYYWWDNQTAQEQQETTETLARVKAALSDILQTNYQNIAIATHGGITRALMVACGYKIEGIANTECFHLCGDGDKWELVSDI